MFLSPYISLTLPIHFYMYETVYKWTQAAML